MSDPYAGIAVEYRPTGAEMRPRGDRTPPPGYRYDPARDSFVRDMAPVSEVAPDGAGPMANYDGIAVEEARQRSYEAAQPSWIEDQFRSFGEGVDRAVDGLIGLPGDFAQGMEGWAQDIHDRHGDPVSRQYRDMYRALGFLPTSDEVHRFLAGMENRDPARYEPATQAGEYSRSIGEQIPGALSGRGWTRVLDPVLAGAGSEFAGDMASQFGPQAEAAARFAGGFGGSMTSNLMPNGRELSMLGGALRGIPPADLQAAQSLMAEAQARGVQLTLAEAVDQVTGSSRVTSLQRLLEPTPAGMERFGPVMAARPDQVREATLDSLAQWAPPSSPSEVARRTQAGAESALGNARRRVNADAQPFYDALPGQTIDDGAMAWLQGDPSYAAAAQALRENPVLGPRWAQVPDADMAFHNAVVKRMGRDADAASRVEVNPLADREVESAILDSQDIARSIGQQASSDYAQALEIVARGHRDVIDPLKAGPLGILSGERPHPNIGAQENALFPTAAPEGQSLDTMWALRLLAKEDPELPRDILRQHLGSEFAEAAQDLPGGPNAWGGAQFRARVMGNPNQRQTLEEALRSVGGDDTLDLMQVLEATGQRQRPGSPTAFFGQGMEELKGSNTLSRGLRGGWSPWRSMGDALEEFNARRNASSLSDALLSDPKDALAVMERAQSVVDDNKLLRALLAGAWSQ